MTLHIAGTFYVPEGDRVTVSFPSLREGNDSGRVLLFEDRGEIYVPAYIEEADSDDLLLLNQYNAAAVVEAVAAQVEHGGIDPSEGRWEVHRDAATDRLSVDYLPPVESASDAMGGDDG